MSTFSVHMVEDIGRKLVEENLISADQLAVALETKKNLGGDLGTILIRKGFLSEEQIQDFIEQRLTIPVISVDDYTIDPEVVRLVSSNLARRFRFMPLFRIGDTITIAMADSLAVFALGDIRNEIKHRVQPVFAPAQEIERLIHHHYGTVDSTDDSANDDVVVVQYGTESSGGASEKLQEMASGAKVVAEVNRIIQIAVGEEASDIHIEPQEKTVRIRNRLNGALEERLTMPRLMHLPIVTRIKILSGMDIAERRIPQDGRVRLRVGGKVVDMRVSTYPTMHGEKVVVRLLGHDRIYGLEDLGMTGNDREVFEGLIHRPYGVFLVTGPTGSGKTTTLYAALSRINSRDRNIVSIEDPIENEIPGISQAQINPRAGLTFAAALRSILRQDPDVIMIGEIRDHETADIAVRAAITGHLVFSTLHTNTAVGAITRLEDLGLERFLISSALLGVMAQRLIRKLCPACKKPAEIDEAVRKEMGIPDATTIYRAGGCTACRMSGYIGRLGIFELIEVNAKLRSMIVDNAGEEELKNEAARRGMSSLRNEALGRVLEGQTTIEEVIRITSEEE